MHESLIFWYTQKARKNNHIIKVKKILLYYLWFNIWKKITNGIITF